MRKFIIFHSDDGTAWAVNVDHIESINQLKDMETGRDIIILGLTSGATKRMECASGRIMEKITEAMKSPHVTNYITNSKEPD